MNDAKWMAEAMLAAVSHTCDRAPVGVVVVQDDRLTGKGYNGAASGCDECDDVGHLMINGHCERAIHAEVNAIINCRGRAKGGTLYTTHHPCPRCAGVIVNAGIVAVRYSHKYRLDPRAQEILSALDVKAVSLDDAVQVMEMAIAKQRERR